MGARSASRVWRQRDSRLPQAAVRCRLRWLWSLWESMGACASPAFGSSIHPRPAAGAPGGRLGLRGVWKRDSVTGSPALPALLPPPGCAAALHRLAAPGLVTLWEHAQQAAYGGNEIRGFHKLPCAVACAGCGLCGRAWELAPRRLSGPAYIRGPQPARRAAALGCAASGSVTPGAARRPCLPPSRRSAPSLRIACFRLGA